MAEAVGAAEALVQRVMGAWDSSHDPFHAFRVRDLALSLANEECLPHASLEIVELAALLHDIDDHKYTSRAGQDNVVVEGFLKQQGVEAGTAEAILSIITSMGFKEEVGGSLGAKCSPEFAVVQDADRLDAMGAIGARGKRYYNQHWCPRFLDCTGEMGTIAIGIARAFTYGGSRNRTMHDPAKAPRTGLTKAQYVSSDVQQTTVNHFHEKLLKLKDLMKTKAGRQRAEGRHRCMEVFLEQFRSEWEGKL